MQTSILKLYYAQTPFLFQLNFTMNFIFSVEFHHFLLKFREQKFFNSLQYTTVYQYWNYQDLILNNILWISQRMFGVYNYSSVVTMWNFSLCQPYVNNLDLYALAQIFISCFKLYKNLKKFLGNNEFSTMNF